MSDSPIQTRLPENAYRELKPGEVYTPMVPAGANVPEITGRSIAFGIFMNIAFAMAATYLALKAGQGIETAIPISVLSVGLSGFLAKIGYRRSSLLENVNILAIGTTSGIVAGGTCFTMPAIYMLGLQEKLKMGNVELFLLIFFVPFIGAVLGVLFLVPFRRYFVRDMHGKLPFPEGTATNEILATGASDSGGQAWTLIYSCIIAGIYNFLSTGMKLFSDVFQTGELVGKFGKQTYQTLAIPALEKLTNSVKAIFLMGTGAYYLGLGYIIGLRYCTIIVCGSFLSYFILVPLFAGYDLPTLKALNPAIPSTSAEHIFKFIPKIIGIGGIFTAGILSILKMSKVIVTALKEALGSLFKGSQSAATHDRTDLDISYRQIALIGLATVALMFVFFRIFVLAELPGATKLTIIATILALVLSFLFTTVSAWAIAMISTTPLSGMTVTTIIITAVVLVQFGLPKGNASMLAVLLVGGVVCTALSMAGTLVTEFKISYWLGATPKKIQQSAIIASLLGSVFVTIMIMALANRPGYVVSDATPNPLEAPQANMMKSALETFLSADTTIPWTLYCTGAVVAVIMLMMGISPLAFCLGMYLPMNVNTPLLIGGFLAYWLAKSSKNEGVNKARTDKGILIASGLIAGASIVDVLLNMWGTIVDDNVSSAHRLLPKLDMTEKMLSGRTPEQWAQMSNWLGLIAFVVLAILMYIDCRRAKPGDAPALPI